MAASRMFVATKPRTIDEYLAGLSPEDRTALQKVRRAVQTAAPEAEECLSYGMPAFRLHGKLVAGFKAAANHCSFHPMSGDTVATLESDLAGYDTSRGTIRYGGPAPVRRYLPQLIDLVMTGAITPGKVFDLTLPPEQVAEGHRAMDERRAIKTLLRP